MLTVKHTSITSKSCLMAPCSQPLLSCPSPAPGNHGSAFCHYSFAFSRVSHTWDHTIYSFGVWLLSLSMFVTSIVSCLLARFSFLTLHSIVLHPCATVCSFIGHLMDMWVVPFVGGTLMNKAAMNIHVCLCVCGFFSKERGTLAHSCPKWLRVDEEAGKAQGVKRKGYRPAWPRAAGTARNLSPLDHIVLKGQGPGEGNRCVYFLSPWCWESCSCSECGVGWDVLPAAAVLLTLFLVRMAHFQFVPSTLPLIDLHAPPGSSPQSHTRAPQTQGPSIPGPLNPRAPLWVSSGFVCAHSHVPHPTVRQQEQAITLLSSLGLREAER